MKKIIVKSGSLPARKIHRRPDSELHEFLRAFAYTVLGVVSLFSAIIMFGQSGNGLHPVMLILIALVFGFSTIDPLIRPGKGKVWLITLVVAPCLFFCPVLIFVIPVIMLFVQYFKTRLDDGENSTRNQLRRLKHSAVRPL